MDFRPPKLPVTCGQAKGILSKEIMKEGEFPGLPHFSTGNYPHVDVILFKG